jgi:hypothetical protein
MNIKRLILAIVVAFVVLWVTDFFIHGIWMMPDYRTTQSLWRPEAEMGSYMGWMLCAQLLFVSCAIGYGVLMGVFSGVWAIIMYVVVPMPCSIATKWFFAGIVQTILLALVTFWIYKPSVHATAT